MTVIEAINLAIGVIEIMLVGLILRGSWSIRREIPAFVWAICAFFTIDALVAINRSELMWERSETFILATMLDLISLVVLAYIFFNAKRIANVIISVSDQARYRKLEYERARREYTQVVRHRIMNPVTVILGATETLRAGALDDKELTERLLLAIDEAAQVIRDETLTPERRDELERDLDALPHVDESQVVDFTD